MLPSASKRGRGRPSKPLRVDPNRYLYAFLQVQCEREKRDGISEQRVAEVVAGILHGQPTPTIENFMRILSGQPFQVETSKRSGNLSENASRWRNRNVFRTHAEDLLRKLRELRKGDPTSSDTKWLSAVSACMWIAFEGWSTREGLAAFMAADVGETAYYETVLGPILRDRADHRRRGRG